MSHVNKQNRQIKRMINQRKTYIYIYIIHKKVVKQITIIKLKASDNSIIYAPPPPPTPP